MITLLKKLEEYFATIPDKEVLQYSSDGSSITYGQLNQYSSKVYGYLRDRNIGRDDVVLIHLPRSIQILEIMVGVWKAGASFVVCEDSMPEERVRYIASDCGCKEVIEEEELIEIEKESPRTGRETVGEHDAAYIVYTSGSTGNPKGVIHEFGNIEESVRAKRLNGRSIIQSSDVLAVNSPLNFIAAMDYFINVLNVGATMMLMDMADVKNPQKLATVYENAGVTVTFMTPSLYRACGKFNSQMQCIFLGGEPCSAIFDPNIRIIHGYNLSEAGRDICLFPIDKKYEITPIGHNHGDEEIVLLKEDGTRAELGEIGEICFKNEFVRGYIGLPEKTAEAWKNGLYHTGDLAVMDEYGEITFRGRNDDMIKISGNRIEPVEIENVAKSLLNINAVAKGFVTPQNAFVVLYYTDDVDVEPSAAREKLHEKLPHYMLPSYFVHLEHFPLLANGKINRRGLPIPEIDDYRKEYIAPVTSLQKNICDAFERVLGVENIGIDDDFYELGGDSVKSMELLTVANIASLDVFSIYSGRTVRRIAEIIEESKNGDAGYLEQEARHHDIPINAFETYLFDYQIYAPQSTLCNMPHLWKMKKQDVDTERLVQALYRLVESHPALKTVFRFNEDLVLVKHYDEKMQPVIAVEDVSEKEFEDIRMSLVRPFKMLNSPLYWFRVFRTESYVYLFMDISHLISDGTSMQVMEQDLSKAYHNELIEKDYYYLISEGIYNRENGVEAENARKYNTERYDGKKWTRNITPDHHERSNHAGMVKTPLGIRKSEIEDFLKCKGISLNVLCITAALLTLRNHEQSQDIMVSWLYSGRDSAMHNNTIGLLIKELPVAVSFGNIQSMDELLLEVKNQTIKGMEAAWDPYVLRNSSISEDDVFRVRNQGKLLQCSCIEGIPYENTPLQDTNQASFLMDIQIAEDKTGELETLLVFNSSMVEQTTGEDISRMYLKCVHDVLRGRLA